MFNNPLIERYRYSVMRPRQLWIYMGIYITIIALILFINYSIYQFRSLFVSEVSACRSIFYQFLFFQALTLLFCGAYNSNSAIRDEITGNTYDFFRMLPLGALQKAIGILTGKNLVVLLFAAINFVFLLIFGIVGGVNIALQVQLFLVLVSTAFLTSSTALLKSIYSRKQKRSSNLAVLLLLGFFVLPASIQLMAQLTEFENLETFGVFFFNISIPILLLIAFIALYFGFWVLKGIVRKFTREREPLFTRAGAFLFMLGYEFIAVGLFYVHFSEADSRIYWSIRHFFWLVTFVPVVLIQLGSLRSFDNYLELSAPNAVRQQPGKRTIATMLLNSNLSLGIGLFGVWAVLCMSVMINHKLDMFQHLGNIVVLFSFYMFLILIAELYAVYEPFYSKIGVLSVFVAVLYLLLPLILAVAMDYPTIHRFSLLGYFLGRIGQTDVNIGFDISILLMNTVLCTIVGLLVWKQYVKIVAFRRQM